MSSILEMSEQSRSLEGWKRPLLESYQLDWLASRCSRKSFNLLKDSLRESGCAFQYSTFCLILALAFL